MQRVVVIYHALLVFTSFGGDDEEKVSPLSALERIQSSRYIRIMTINFNQYVEMIDTKHLYMGFLEVHGDQKKSDMGSLVIPTSALNPMYPS